MIALSEVAEEYEEMILKAEAVLRNISIRRPTADPMPTAAVNGVVQGESRC